MDADVEFVGATDDLRRDPLEVRKATLASITRTDGLWSYTRLNSSNFSVNPLCGVCVVHRHRSLPQSSSASRFTAGAAGFLLPSAMTGRSGT
jgi:hypothetical protein